MSKMKKWGKRAKFIRYALANVDEDGDMMKSFYDKFIPAVYKHYTGKIWVYIMKQH